MRRRSRRVDWNFENREAMVMTVEPPLWSNVLWRLEKGSLI